MPRKYVKKGGHGGKRNGARRPRANLSVRPPLTGEGPTPEEILTDWRTTHKDLLSDNIEGVIHDARRERLSRRLDRLADQWSKAALMKAKQEKAEKRKAKR